MQWCLARSCELSGFCNVQNDVFQVCMRLKLESRRTTYTIWQVQTWKTPIWRSSQLQWSSISMHVAEGSKVRGQVPMNEALELNIFEAITRNFWVYKSAVCINGWKYIHITLVYSGWLNLCSNIIDLNIMSKNRLLNLLSLHNTLVFE